MQREARQISSKQSNLQGNDRRQNRGNESREWKQRLPAFPPVSSGRFPKNAQETRCKATRRNPKQSQSKAMQSRATKQSTAIIAKQSQAEQSIKAMQSQRPGQAMPSNAIQSKSKQSKQCNAKQSEAKQNNEQQSIAKTMAEQRKTM